MNRISVGNYLALHSCKGSHGNVRIRFDGNRNPGQYCPPPRLARVAPGSGVLVIRPAGVSSGFSAVTRSERLNSGAGSKTEVNVDLYALFYLILSPRARIRRYRW